MWSARLFREQHDYGTGTAFPVSRGLAGRAGLPGDPGGHRDRPVQRRRTCHRTRPGRPADVSATPVREALRRLEQEGLIERVSARQLRVVDHSSGTLRELLLAGAALRALEARFATHKITEAALDRMAAIVDAQSSEQGIDIPERLRIAREFDMEIERAADNPTLRGMILSLSIIGQERRTRSVESLLAHPEVGLRRVQDHRDLLAAFRRRDPDQVEQVFRRHATAGIELLLDDLD